MDQPEVPLCTEEFGINCLWLIGSQVKLLLVNEHVLEGTINAVDPLTGSVILKTDSTTEFVMGHAILKYDVLKRGDGTFQIASENVSTTAKPSIDAASHLRRKEELKNILEQNRIPYEETGNDRLVILDVATITPPYREEDISSFNEVVLLRVRKLIPSSNVH